MSCQRECRVVVWAVKSPGMEIIRHQFIFKRFNYLWACATCIRIDLTGKHIGMERLNVSEVAVNTKGISVHFNICISFLVYYKITIHFVAG